ncbi:hypothetical protein AB0F11_26150 [Streptomyces sp. NPDC032472]|uniref:hypothetical protein n=1 Tax=Streptomyces sp. NPDC032472 TaxID=3155018 RepID=UPI00340D12F7
MTAHPLVALATGAVLVTGTATYVTWPEPAHRVPGVIPAPTAGNPTPIPSSTITSAGPSPVSPPAVAGTVPLGAQSLESADEPALYLTYAGDFATLGRVSASSSAQTRQRVTFTVVGGWPTLATILHHAVLDLAASRVLRRNRLRSAFVDG